MPLTRTVTPDKGWAWVIMTGAFFCNMCVGGILYTFGIFYVEFVDYFQASRATTAWIGSVIGAMYALVGPLASILANKYGCYIVTIIGTLLVTCGFIGCIFCKSVWSMVITYSIIGGFGLGIAYHCGFVMVGHCFEKKRPLTLGIISCGSSFGSFVFAPMSSLLISLYNWQGAMLVITGLILNNMAVGLIYMQYKNHQISQSNIKVNGHNQPMKKQLQTLEVLKLPACSILCICTLLKLLGCYIPLMFLPDLARAMGFPKDKGAFLLSLVGIGNTVGRALAGVIANTSWGDSLVLNYSALIGGGIVTIICPWLTNYTLLCVYSILFGLSFGVSTAVVAIILVEFLGPQNLSHALGIVSACRGIATLVGSPVAGALFDSSGSYKTPFVVAGVFIVLAGVICLPLRKLHNCVVDSNERDLSTEAENETNEIKHLPQLLSMSLKEMSMSQGSLVVL